MNLKLIVTTSQLELWLDPIIICPFLVAELTLVKEKLC